MRNVTRAVPLLLLCCVLSACEFVAPYDSVFDQEIVSTQRDVDTLLTRIAGSAAPGDQTSSVTYNAVAVDYARIDLDFTDLAARAGIHQNNTNTLAGVKAVQDTFDRLRDAHAREGVLNAGHVRNSRAELDHSFLVLMQQEISKHHSA